MRHTLSLSSLSPSDEGDEEERKKEGRRRRRRMLAQLGVPRLSYSQLFSFQVDYSNNADSRGYANAGAFGFLARKKGEWKKAILEVDFTMGTFFIQDKDRILLSNTFSAFKRHVTQDEYSDDLLLSIRFETEQWEVMVQNTIEKKTLTHLLECILDDLSPEDTSKIAKEKGIIGLEKTIMKYGLVYRRAKTAYKKDERFLIVVPGKLILFKGMDIMGKHVRTVTSLAGATVRMIYGQLEFEVVVPNAKSLNFLPATAEDLTGWIGVIEKSIRIANSDVGEIRQNQSPRSLTDTSPSQRRTDISEKPRRRGDEVPDEERGPNQQKDKYQVQDGAQKGKYHSDHNYKENPLQGKTKGRQGGEESSGHRDKNESSSRQRGNEPTDTVQGDVRDRYDRERRNYDQEYRNYREDGSDSYQRYQWKKAGRGEDGYKGKREQEWSEEEDDSRNKGKGYSEKRKEGDDGHKGKHRQEGQREYSDVECRRKDCQGMTPDADFGHKGKGYQVRRGDEGDNANSDGYSGKGRRERREEDADDGYRGKIYQGRTVEQRGKGFGGSIEDQEREEREKQEQERWNRERQEKERQRISHGQEERRHGGSYQERSDEEQGSRKKNGKDFNSDEEGRHSGSYKGRLDKEHGSRKKIAKDLSSDKEKRLSGSYQERSDKEHGSRKKNDKDLSSDEEVNHWSGKRRGSSRSRGSSNGPSEEASGGSMSWPQEDSDSDDEEPSPQVKEEPSLPLKNPPQNTSQLKKQLPIQPIRGSNAGLGTTSTKNRLEKQEEFSESNDDEEE